VATCPDCDGRGEYLDAPGNVLDGRSYMERCSTCGGTGSVKLCVTCNEPIPTARLEAKPDAVQCIKCLIDNGDEPPLRGHMQWDHKTAPSIEIGTRLAAEPRNAHPREGKSGIGTGNCQFDAEDFYVVVVRSCKRHPDRRAVSAKSQLCAECAVEWYRSRIWPV
jgi:hypothetical protein